MNNSYIDNFEPSQIKDIFGNLPEIQRLLETLKNDPYNTYIISGPNGIGKSSAIKVILKELNYDVIFYDSVTYNNESIIDKLVNLNHNNILCRMNNIKPKITALVIDNFDHITLSNEKTIIENLLDFNLKNKKIPIIFIINNSSYKILEEFKKKNMVFTFNLLTTTETKKYCYYILNKLKITCNENILLKIINFAQKDIRRLKLLLQDISITMTNKGELTDAYLNQYIKHSELKNKDFNLFESYKDMLISSTDFKKILLLYNDEKVLLPLIVHENCYKDIFSKKIPIKEKVRLCKQISEYISKGDVIETDIYSFQSWHLQNYHCFISCIYPIYMMNSTKPYTSTDEIKYNISFSSELNKTSLKNINRKNFTILLNSFQEYESSDLLEMGRILNFWFYKEKYENIKKFIKYFKHPDMIKLLEIFLKIDKCNLHQFILSTKIKKYINVDG